MTTPPDLSVVVPAYNRGELIRYTLESVRRASAGLATETIVVDDGSDIPVERTIAGLGCAADRIVRKENEGLLFARLRGLREATGRYVMFLDSDDLVSAGKFRAQIAAMDKARADVSYTDTARCTLEGEYDQLAITADELLAETSSAAEFYILVQPAPHSPMFRTDYVRRVVAEALFPPSPLYNPVAEIWFYHNAAPRAARILKVPGEHAIIGQHPNTRLTDHWERLGVASLAVQEAFARSCPDEPEAADARQLVAEKAFLSWRRLPRQFSPEFCDRQLAIWRRLGNQREIRRLGGRGFRAFARLAGPVAAGHLLRQVCNGRYESVRTLDDAMLHRILAELPPQSREACRRDWTDLHLGTR